MNNDIITGSNVQLYTGMLLVAIELIVLTPHVHLMKLKLLQWKELKPCVDVVTAGINGCGLCRFYK